MPRIDGIERFRGPSFHTYHWPHEGADLKGKRIAVIGTGATAVQLIPEVAKEAADLFVFQRRPNWCAPLHNAKIGEAEMAEIRSRYDEIFAQCAKTPGGFIHMPDRRKLFEVPEDERLAFFEELYASSGFRIWQGNFRDILMEESANAAFSEFVADKIRSRVKDPETAEKLIPRDHGFGTRRVPMETNYYETYNRDDVTLVDVSGTGIERFVEGGLIAEGHEYELDAVVFATGFDALTGSVVAIDITGPDGTTMAEAWAGGPATYLGLSVAGFPNLFNMQGPGSPGVFVTMVTGIEHQSEWIIACLEWMREHGHTRIEATETSQRRWGDIVDEAAARSLRSRCDSWYTGANIDGKHRKFMPYIGGFPAYLEQTAQEAAEGYPGHAVAGPAGAPTG